MYIWYVLGMHPANTRGVRHDFRIIRTYDFNRKLDTISGAFLILFE